jgi:SAM-dependent methyltransferase
MCNSSGIAFGKSFIKKEEVRDKSVIEVGSYDINGSLRSVVNAYGPSSYIGVDLEFGHGVDQICSVEELINKFGCDRFDMLISTELLEHVQNWQTAIHNMKSILKPGGVLLITTRSKGFWYHGYPFDFWRYEKSDMEFIFSDFDIKVLESDPLSPGVFLKAKKPLNFVENKLEDYKLYSILEGKRSLTTIRSFYWRLVVLPIWKMRKIYFSIPYLDRIVCSITHPSKVPELMKLVYKKFLARTTHSQR